MQELVSVIIPVRNASKFLHDSLASIFNQSYQDIEIIVVDDGSDDQSIEILKSFQEKVKIISQSKVGAWAARNRAISESSGDIICLHDADDISLPLRVELQVNELKNNPNSLIFTHLYEFKDKFNPNIKEREIEKIKLAGVCPGTLLLKKNLFYKIGEFENKWILASFLDWLKKAQSLGIQKQVLSQALLARRIHSENTTLKNKDLLKKEYLEVIKNNLIK